MSNLILLCTQNPGAPEANLVKIAQFLGVAVNVLKTVPKGSGHSEIGRYAWANSEALAISAESLVELWGDAIETGAWQRIRETFPRHVLIYGFEQTEAHSRLLRAVSSDSLSGVGVVTTSGAKTSVSQDWKKLCQQLSGLSFETQGAGLQFVFNENLGKNHCSSLISISGKPILVSLSEPRSQIMLLAGKNIADLDAPVPAGSSLLEFFSGLVPMMLFLRFACGSSTWRNDRSFACFIVDDPLLKKRYGFLDFQKLLEVMHDQGFCTSIAFIPWNFDRSESGLVKQFIENPRRYSLCVHGCDHTSGEFGSSNQTVLQQKAQLALERMSRHRTLSGIGFDDVMVFPQGIFSTAAMRALKSCGYLAAVNTSAYPVDAEPPLQLRDLVQVAVTRFADLPLFTRRYPSQSAELAFDLFLGKPALVVEHHGFFRQGFRALTDIIKKLNALDVNLEWTNLSAICAGACQKRIGENGEIQLRFFTDRFLMRNGSDCAQQYRLFRELQPADDIAAVTINGTKMSTNRNSKGMWFEITLEARQEAEIRLARANSGLQAPPRRRDHFHDAKVFIRRSLSELRDNYLDRAPLISKTTRNLTVCKSNPASVQG